MASADEVLNWQLWPNHSVACSATGISGSAAASIPGTFFKMNWGNQLGAAVRSAKRKADERIGDVDCYVLTREARGTTQTLWIGKQDLLIRQVERITSAKVLAAALEGEAKKHPEVQAMLDRNKASGIPLAQETKSVETHTNIRVNPQLSPADFAR